MRVPTLYLDTSVLGGYFDDEFAEPTRELWRQRVLGLFQFVTSSVVRAELQDAPDEVKNIFQDTFREPGELIEFNAEMFDLTRAYLARAVVAPSYAVDARHMAVCSAGDSRKIAVLESARKAMPGRFLRSLPGFETKNGSRSNER